MQSLERLTEWIRKTVPDGRDVVVPISGGTDSALCFWLYNHALPGRVVGVYYGTHLRAESWFRSFGEVRTIELLPDLLDDPELLRWTRLLNIALLEGRVLIGARNKTEHVLGTFSHASRVAFHLPLASTWKSEIFALCELIGVPDEVMGSSRAADPVCGRTEEYLRIPFDLIDSFLQEKIGEKPMSDPALLADDQRAYLESIYQRASYKKDLPFLA